MTFKHKLSARLARLWLGLPLFALLSLASCDLRARSVAGPVPPGALDRVQVSPPVVTLATTATTEFIAVGMTASGDTAQSAVTWSVSGGVLVQTTDNGGRHIGRYQAGSQPGTYRVIVTARSGSVQKSDTANVIVTAIPVATVVVSPAAVALDVGQTAQLAATPQDASGAPLSGRAISWASGNTAVATVSASGLVTAKAAGATTVTAASEGKSGSASVTVTQVPVASVEVTPASASIAPGGTAQLTAVAKDGAGAILSGRPTAWSTSSAQIATVGGGGLVTGVAAGSAQIVATTEGKSDTATITVAVIPVASVEVTPASANIAVGSAVQLAAVAKDGAGGILSGRPMTWSSSSAQIATVAAGLVAGVAAGTAYVVVSSEGKSDTATITVTFVPVASVTVSPDATSVAVDGNYQFAVILKDAAGNVLNGRPVTWSSGNPAVATVSASGLARGVATGTATITALSEGISGSASLTVFTAPPPGQCGAWPAGITAWIGPLPVSSGQAFYASPTGSDANPGTLAAPWKSLAKANTLQPGQVLYLRAGTYGARGTTFSFSIRGTASQPITLAGYPGDGRPIIQGKVYVSGQWLRVTGLIFDGPTGNVGGPGPNGEAVLLTLSGQHVELSNSEVRFDYWHAGVGGGGTAMDYRILNNYIHDNGGYNGDYTDAQNNTSHGIYNSPSSYGLIANNVIEHNDAKGITMRHDANHIIITNNTIVGNGRFGVSIVEQTRDIIAANNVVMNNGNMGKGGGGISMHDAGPYTNRNNVFWNNDNSNSASSNYPGSATIINPLIADALLVNPSDGTVPYQVVNPGTDNRLRPGSPAIGYADPNYALPFDITGKCRGSAPDAGAYQR